MKIIGKIEVKKIKTDKHFYEIAAAFAGKRGSVVLLSGGDGDNARFNILAAEPWLEISSKGKSFSIKEGGREEEMSGDPFSYLGDLLKSLSESYSRIIKKTDFPDLPITTGLFGYLSYDLKDHIEEIPRTSMDDLDLPDLYMISPGLLIIEDTKTKTKYGLAVEPESKGGQTTDSLINLIEDALREPYRSGDFSIPDSPLKSNFERTEYEDSVKDIIEYIKNGDIYQVNMSQRFSTDFQGDSYSLFAELFKENPAPFFAYLNCGDHQIVSTSPERFILQESDRVEARPIKGTRPRGKTIEEDKKLKEELQNSLKDDAELSMIVDLLRNDMGKVCKGGSVKVLKHKSLETYKNVYHLVSTIEGFLENDKGSIDLLTATFPGGSITGCPKIRSMEIIDEKEPYRRHIYTGSIGYIGFNNRMDFSIVIRTATVKGGKIFFSVGGGIVYDSDPADEFNETLHKAQSLMKVLHSHQKSQKYIAPNNKIQNPGRNFCWHNGKFVPESKALIPAVSPGYQYGKGVFETLRVRNGEAEYLDEHLKRLDEGCREFLGRVSERLDWKGILKILTDKNSLNKSISSAKIIVSQGNNGLFGNMNITVFCRKYKKRPGILQSKGLKLGIYPRQRETFLADYKSMNYLFYLKAGEWAKKNGYDEAVILNADGSVSETNTGNILIILDKTVVIPESKHRLPGIMEKNDIREYREKGYTIKEERIMPDTLFEIDKRSSLNNKILITNSLIGSLPVLSVAF